MERVGGITPFRVSQALLAIDLVKPLQLGSVLIEVGLPSHDWHVIPSESNFVFAKPPAPFTAKAIFAGLKTKNIFVRYFPGPLTGERLRITIGTDAEMSALLKAIDMYR